MYLIAAHITPNSVKFYAEAAQFFAHLEYFFADEQSDGAGHIDG